jgi:hypothetical protein
MVSRFSRIVGVLGLLGMLVGVAAPAAAEQMASQYFFNTWSQTDQPVSAGVVNRTWMWGPGPNTAGLSEAYEESPNHQRLVQYFDKTRMEITHPDGDASSEWYVTNGLLARELVTGQLQTGDNQFESHAPAQVNVAGDANDPNGPTYATFNTLMGYGAIPNGWVITQTVDRAGNVGVDDNLSSYNVTAVDIGAPTNHTMASVFWDFINSSGTVYQNGNYVDGKLFTVPIYVTGYPLTEPYWTNVLVGGVQKQVLVQVFERRVLTYTPSNPDGWKVEAGNVGQHYYQWRYVDLQQTPAPSDNGGSTTPPNNGGSTTPPPDNGGSADANCSDFATQQAAQQWFNDHGGSPTNNVSGLDNDHDGIVCEGLPSGTNNTPPPSSSAATTFGDGTFTVGVDIAPGTYKNSDSSQACYWERLNSFDDSADAVIANNISTAPMIVTISSTDVGFTSDRCGTWTLDNAPLTSSTTANFGDGTYRVGRDISPGLWKNTDSSNYCYWQRVSGFGGTLDEIIDNGLSDQIQTVRIQPTDVGFSAQSCGSWQRIGD